jgi:hypothetical protein
MTREASPVLVIPEAESPKPVYIGDLTMNYLTATKASLGQQAENSAEADEQRR